VDRRRQIPKAVKKLGKTLDEFNEKMNEYFGSRKIVYVNINCAKMVKRAFI